MPRAMPSGRPPLRPAAIFATGLCRACNSPARRGRVGWTGQGRRRLAVPQGARVSRPVFHLCRCPVENSVTARRAGPGRTASICLKSDPFECLPKASIFRRCVGDEHETHLKIRLVRRIIFHLLRDQLISQGRASGNSLPRLFPKKERKDDKADPLHSPIINAFQIGHIRTSFRISGSPLFPHSRGRFPVLVRPPQARLRNSGIRPDAPRPARPGTGAAPGLRAPCE